MRRPASHGAGGSRLRTPVPARQNCRRPALRAGCRRGRRRTQFLPRRLLRLLPALAFATAGAFAGEVTVAVAANAAEAIETVAAEFEQESGHQVTVTVGSTGKLYAQILHGAPFDLFLAADQERPRLLVEQGLAAAELAHDVRRRSTRALESRCQKRSPTQPRCCAKAPSAGSRSRILILRPTAQPLATRCAQLGLWEGLRSKIVVGENVGQAFAMVASGNAELGFVALSSVLSSRNPQPGSRWEVPARFYTPIRQDAVLLDRAADNPAAHDFLRFLGSPRARKAIASFGYLVE